MAENRAHIEQPYHITAGEVPLSEESHRDATELNASLKLSPKDRERARLTSARDFLKRPADQNATQGSVVKLRRFRREDN